MTHKEINELILDLSFQRNPERVKELMDKWHKYYNRFSTADSIVREFYDKTSPNYVENNKNKPQRTPVNNGY